MDKTIVTDAPFEGVVSVIAAWADRTFPDHTDTSIWAHLVEEIGELAVALEIVDEPYDLGRDVAKEIGDVFVLWATLAARHRPGSVASVVRGVFEELLRREWQTADERGIRHGSGHRDPFSGGLNRVIIPCPRCGSPIAMLPLPEAESEGIEGTCRSCRRYVELTVSRDPMQGYWRQGEWVDFPDAFDPEAWPIGGGG